MKFSFMLIAVMASVSIAANSEARVANSENRGSSVRLHVLSGSVELNHTERSPVDLFEMILPSASETRGRTGFVLADRPPRSKSCPPASPNPGGTPPSCGKV